MATGSRPFQAGQAAFKLMDNYVDDEVAQGVLAENPILYILMFQGLKRAVPAARF